MFASQKRIFAGKSNLSAEPFCPYLTNESGRMSLKRSLSRPSNYSGVSPHAHIFLIGGKSRI
ncbi:MAG: hypothetical protein IJ087_03280 [Eggerthellaceae bacterium]|nr:hypothetical protein [Eggerthellaceae bacterium]